MAELQRNVPKALPSIEWLIVLALPFCAEFFLCEGEKKIIWRQTTTLIMRMNDK
jgi:hypothetical protein